MASVLSLKRHGFIIPAIAMMLSGAVGCQRVTNGRPPVANPPVDMATHVRITRLVATINDHPYVGHLDITPSVEGLSEIGTPAIPQLLTLMLGNDEMTRERAETAMFWILAHLFGFVPGRGWPNTEAEVACHHRWRSLGDLDFEADRASREKAVKLWQAWADSGYTIP